MSHHSEDGILIASSDSFWEPGNFKRTTKRIEDGYKLCSDLMQLVQERAEIEKGYARSLKTWSKKWADAIEKGPEYGTTEAAWKGVLVESDRLYDVHTTIKDDLHNEVIDQIRTWQKENYRKNVINLKERKEMEDSFKKVQKPWAKLMTKVNKAKISYHNACKNGSDTSLSSETWDQDQVKKLEDRVAKNKEEVVQKTREKYESVLQEIAAYKPNYIDEMRDVFHKCQEMEGKRLKFFKNVIFSIHKCVNISEKPEFPKIYEEFFDTISNADYMKDLDWWSNNHGVNMSMNWPTFEDYSMKSKTNGSESNLTNTKENEEIKLNGFGKGERGNPFVEEELNDGEGALVDRGEPGIPVKALYDYEGEEDDELSFRRGEVFENLEGEDDQGWCKGRKDGKVGLYPAYYVEVVH